MLNKFRKNLQPILDKIGSIFATLGISPNSITVMAFIIAVISSIIFGLSSIQNGIWFNTVLLGSILLLISGFFDVIDGSVARISRQTSKKGAFLDSTLDKISEVVIFLGIAIGNLANPILCMIALSSSLLVSYTRSRAESFGVDLSGIGFGERAERLIILAIMGIIPIQNFLEYGVIIIIIISILTIVQRIDRTIKKLS
ncbi:MAG: CDP-alcohol phosphatidyltransferase family protein [Nitrososphaeraceae archaeon]|nr:CDP-alcohol phosphatidyltransferase family protein [Nitrososphaeraceae archaeon]